jgi:NAD(P)H dehydrogenase (quinone)
VVAIGGCGLLRAALARAKPARVVALSTVGADAPQPNLLNALGRMESALGSLLMPVAFLRAAWFMENAEWDIDSAKRRAVLLRC